MSDLIRARRVRFLKQLQLPYLLATFKFIRGGRHPQLFILYKVPLNPSDRDQTRELQAEQLCISQLPHY